MNEPIKYYVRTIFLFAIITLALFSYQTYIYKLFDLCALPLLKIDENDWLLLSFKVLGAICSIYIVFNAVKGFRLSFFHTGAHLFALALYGYLRYQACITNIYIFLPNNITIGYVDIIFIIIAISLSTSIIASFIDFFILLTIRIKKKKDHPTDVIKLIPDTPEENPSKDLLGYTDFAKAIAKQISEIPESNTCSLGIVAKWGVGKSTAINFIEYHLNKDQYITIRFNPRHSYNPSRIQEDFFSFLSSELKQYNSVFSSIFVDYMKSAGIIGRNNTIQVILNLYNVWNKEGESNRIRKAIKSLNKRKRIVVIIEDLDRLLAEEIIEVFKIIDNNAISKNIIFISAYDKEHINKILEDNYKTQNSKFSDKFFSWEAHLPLFPYDKIIDFLKDRFSDQFKETPLLDRKDITTNKNLTTIEENSKIIETLFSINIEFIKSCIISIRDAKRFLNSFNELVNRKKGHIEIEDLLLITLIQYKYPEEYSDLFNYKYIDINPIEDPNKYILKANIDNTVQSINLLKNLFKEERPKKDYTINNKIEFLDYFYYYPQSINKGFLTTLLDLTIDESISNIETWINEKKSAQIFNYFNNLDVLKLVSIQSIYNYIDILLYLQIVHNFDMRTYIRPFFLKAESTEICKKHSIKTDEFKTEFTYRLKGEPGKYPYSLIRELIINIIDQGEKEYFFTKIELQQIAKCHVENYIESKADITENLEIELLYENIDSLEMPDRIIILNKDVCALIKDYIIERPDFYVQSFVRNGMSSSSKDWFMLACEPFWEQIFGSKDEFEAFLNNRKLDTLVNIQLVRNFWKIYALHNYKPIEVTYEDITYEYAISDNLQAKAEEANQIEKYAGLIETINANTSISNEEKIQQLSDIQSTMENIRLRVRKRGEVTQTIKRYINLLSIVS